MSVADNAKSYTQEEFDQLLKERLDTEIAGLKANRDELAKEAKTAKQRLKDYEGVDPAEYQRLKQAAEEAEQAKAAAAGDFETLKKQLVEAHTREKKSLVDGHAKQLGEYETKVKKYQSALEKRLIQAELTKAIAANKGDPDLLLPYAERFVRTRETDEDFEAYVIDASGNARVADGKGTPMSFEAFVQQDLMSKFPRAFDGTGSSGGGASKSNAGGGGARNIAANDRAGFMANLEAIANGKANVV
jgi:hypothetical protein